MTDFSNQFVLITSFQKLNHRSKPILDKNKGIMKSFGMFLKESFIISLLFCYYQNNKVLSIKVLNIASDTDMRRSGC